MDAETAAVFAIGDKIVEVTKMPGWAAIKQKLCDKLIALDSITAIPLDMPDLQKLHEMRARQGAISLVLEWLQEIDGVAEQNKFNKTAFMDNLRRESIIKYFPQGE